MTKTEHSAYTSFLASLELVRIALVDSSFHVDRQHYLGHKNLEIHLDISYELIDKDKDRFTVKPTLQLSGQTTDLLSLRSIYEVEFRCNHELCSEFAKRFAESEVRLVIWPYFREYVSSICNRAQIPAIVLPLTGTITGTTPK